MGTVVFKGDFNCKRYTYDYDKRSESFRSFMQECNLRSLHLETNGNGPVCTFQTYQGGPKTAIDHIIVSIENLTKCLKIQVPGWLDGICYEHLKYGGKLLQSHLCSLFNLVPETCYTSKSWKDSCIIPLFKGGNKSKSDPNSYRGISLLCSISKLFEKALYTRLPSLHHNFPHQSQVAYQKALPSTHTSFNMQEVVLHNLKRQSNSIVTLLDSMKAFDTLWHK
ncbi:unnamed protein product [Mytilus edulis]|uniref:Reverse transcriptase domain-containing protein n=1 Tax=Mytilus edulis TaxID=6550 RepID=A0A8S3VIL1_MYTED|nr:unnamed protein product [Mytilus edulis]